MLPCPSKRLLPVCGRATDTSGRAAESCLALRPAVVGGRAAEAVWLVVMVWSGVAGGGGGGDPDTLESLTAEDWAGRVGVSAAAGVVPPVFMELRGGANRGAHNGR